MGEINGFVWDDSVKTPSVPGEPDLDGRDGPGDDPRTGSGGEARGDRPARRAHPPALLALTVILALEAAAMIALAAWLVVEAIVTTPASYASAIAIVVLAVLAALWLVFATVAAARGRSWVRAGAVTWQVLQGAVAIGFFQGDAARPGIGLALLIPALAGIALALSPQVVRATADRPR